MTRPPWMSHPREDVHGQAPRVRTLREKRDGVRGGSHVRADEDSRRRFKRNRGAPHGSRRLQNRFADERPQEGGRASCTKAYGGHMSIVDGGPTRLIFPSDSDMARNTDMWI